MASGTTKTLRYIPLISFFFSICFGIPYAVVGGGLMPALGLMFLAISSAVSLLALRGSTSFVRRVLFSLRYEYRIVLGNDKNEEPPVATSSLLVFGDLALAVLHAVLFALTFVEMADSKGDAILGTFASLSYLATL